MQQGPKWFWCSVELSSGVEREFLPWKMNPKGEKKLNLEVSEKGETEALAGKMAAHCFAISRTSAEQKRSSRFLAAQCIQCTHSFAVVL